MQQRPGNAGLCDKQVLAALQPVLIQRDAAFADEAGQQVVIEQMAILQTARHVIKMTLLPEMMRKKLVLLWDSSALMWYFKGKVMAERVTVQRR